MKYIRPAAIATLLLAVTLAGCSVVGPGIDAQNADIAISQGNVDEALALYLKVLEDQPDGKYTNHAHFRVAEIYKDKAQWDDALQRYQAVADRVTTGYLAGRARSRIGDIRKQSQIIKLQKTAWENRIMTTESGKTKAANALLALGDAHHTLGDYNGAIKWYKTFVAEFPAHQRAAQIQYKVGNIYFYQLYDYDKGWPEYVKLIEDDVFADNYERKEAEKLLKKVKTALDGIKQDMDYIGKYRREKAMDFEKQGRKVTQSAKYSVFSEQIAQTYKSIARAWEVEPLSNFPNAIKAYQELADELPQEKSAAAEALFKVGELNQSAGRYELSLVAYQQLFDRAPESGWRDDAVYNQARCYEAIREFTKAYNRYKDYMSLGEDSKFYRPAEQKVRQFEYDEDGDGYRFYQEQEAGTSDKDANAYPGSKQMQAKS